VHEKTNPPHVALFPYSDRNRVLVKTKLLRWPLVAQKANGDERRKLGTGHLIPVAMNWGKRGKLDLLASHSLQGITARSDDDTYFN
jgi:hypothetical protein